MFYFFILILLAGLIGKKKWKNLFILVECTVGAFVADLINSHILKTFFQRARPDLAILRTPKQGSFSFPSSHAVDVFFIVVFLGLYFPKTRKFLFPLAALTAISRVYCGVHYPGDILAGAMIGGLMAFLYYRLMKKIQLKKSLGLVSGILFLMSFSASAVEDPTQGKPFFPWVWEDQLKPTLVKSVDQTGLLILGSGTAASLGVHHYDKKIDSYVEQGGNVGMSNDAAEKFGKLGNGALWIGIGGLQLFVDQKNGLGTLRALLLTSVSHIGVAALVRRDRPDNKTDFLPFPSSFPSGHTSSAFAFAGSMAYAYGWKGGVPAYALATAVGVSRLKERRHWASDITAGAFLGTFWARAAFAADKMDKEAFLVLPVPVDDGMMISALKEF